MACKDCEYFEPNEDGDFDCPYIFDARNDTLVNEDSENCNQFVDKNISEKEN